MTHNDPTLYAEFAEIADTCQKLRTRAGFLATAPDFPPQLMEKASLLAYDLLQAQKDAKVLAGDKPAELMRHEEMKGGGAA
jgi:hypothetical protein